MKKVVVATLLLFIAAVGVACFYFLKMPHSLIVWLTVSVAACGYTYVKCRDEVWHEKWRKSSPDLDSSEFDRFYWNLTILNQFWYGKHILKPKGIKHLLERYQKEIKQVAEDDGMPYSDKVRIFRQNAGRISSLVSIMELL